VNPSAPACPRCLWSPLRPGVRHCPRCGLADVAEAAADRSPLDVTVGSRVFRVLERVGVGSASTVYRCRFNGQPGSAPAAAAAGPFDTEGVVKVARDGRTNDLLVNEVATLRRLRSADPGNRYTPFLPAVEATFALAADDGPAAPGQPPPMARQATVFRMHPEIRSAADELYSLDEVRLSHPDGLDPRHVAWIWRRVLTILGFAHQQGVIHGAVLPPHILVEPREHKLVLVDWCCAVPADGTKPLREIAGDRFARWYKRESASRNPPRPAIDVALAARSMIFLMGGDPLAGTLPAGVDPALERYYSRCMNAGPNARPDPWRLLDDFDKLIAALWGRRRFVPLPLPPKLRL
jgi:serine/threonine protein kinase